MVPGISRDIEVKLASGLSEWEAAFRLVRKNYVDNGYEAPSGKLLRFTPYHAIQETKVLVAMRQGGLLATVTVVPDNRPLGLPLETLYGEEVEGLRRQGRRMAEVTSLAAGGLSQREFTQVFATMIRLLMQCHLREGGDTWVIAVNPRHRSYYTKMLGFAPLGPCRAYETVAGAPAEAYWLTESLMKAADSKLYSPVFQQPLPDELLEPVPMPQDVVRYLAAESSQIDALDADQILAYARRNGPTRAW